MLRRWRFFRVHLLSVALAALYSVVHAGAAQPNMSQLAGGDFDICASMTPETLEMEASDGQPMALLPLEGQAEHSLDAVSLWCLQTAEIGGPVWIVAESDDFDIWIEIHEFSEQQQRPRLLDADDDGIAGSDDAILAELSLSNAAYLVRVGTYDFFDGGLYTIRIEQSDPGIEVDPGNCAITFAGQGWHASGGSGGSYVAEVGTENSKTTAEIPYLLDDGFGATIDPNETVVLIVMDDFSGVVPVELAAGADGSALAVAGLSHGDMVTYHLTRIDEVYASQLNRSASFRPNVLPFVPGINVVGFDIGSYKDIDRARMDLIAADLRLSVEWLVTTQGVGRIVVNQSFSILPCADVPSLTAEFLGGLEPVSDIAQYDDDVAADLSGLRSAVENAHDTIATDSLLKLLSFYFNPDVTNYPKPGRIVFVAAAGNIGPDTVHLYPGAWPNVVSVTAHDDTGALAPYASPGEVVLPGGWYRYEDSTYFYTGTSYAAPLLSYIAAVYLQQEIPSCPFENDFDTTTWPLFPPETPMPAIEHMRNVLNC